MTDDNNRISNDLLYEVLKSIQAQVSVIREDTNLIKSRVSSIERRMGDVHSQKSVDQTSVWIELIWKFVQSAVNLKSKIL